MINQQDNLFNEVDDQLKLDFEQADKEQKEFALGIKKFVISTLRQSKQPSAGELLSLLELEFGWRVRHHYRNIVTELRKEQKLQSYLKSYLSTTLCDDAISEALREGLEHTNEFKSTIDDLIKRSVDYRKSWDFYKAIEFTAKFRDYAPYNNLLVRVQNPSCSFYATENDWRKRFDRIVKEDAKPMIILATMHPVMLVYDLDDTEGKLIPNKFLEFSKAEGDFNKKYLDRIRKNAARHKILIQYKSLGSLHGGFATTRLRDGKYKMRIVIHNKLKPIEKFAILMHELGHIFLGHLGTDEDQWWPCRINLTHSSVEIEAECVSFVVCERLGIKTSSEKYLATYLKNKSIPESVSLDLIVKVASKLEKMSIELLPVKKSKLEKNRS